MLTLRFPSIHSQARPGTFLCLAIAGALLLFLSLTGAASAQDQAGEDEEQPFDLGYEVTIEGQIGNGLRDRVRAVSRLVALSEHPPLTIGGLRARAQRDIDRMYDVLHAEGYYAAEISSRVDRDATPIQVVFEVAPGRRYSLSEVTLAFTEESGDLSTDLFDYGILPGGAALSAEVVEMTAQVLEILKHRGYPFAQLADRRVVVDHETRQMRVSLTIDSGPLTRFDGMRISGAPNVRDDFIERFKLWEKGDIYDQRLVDEMRNDLIDANLFSIVTAKVERPLDESGEGTLVVNLQESAHRTIGGGGRYSQSEGFGISGFWEHRNMFHRGETFRVTGDLAEIRQELSVNLMKPQFLRRGQTLTLSSSVKHEDTDAFEEFSLGASALLDRELSERWDGTIGTTVELSEIRDTEGKRTFLLLGLPLGLRFDGSDSTLDPTTGARLRLSTIPYVNTIGNQDIFVVNEMIGSAYYQVTEAPRVVLASRVRLGAITGSGRATIPANKRFYSGGGGSVRGIDYQEAGPVDEDEDPLGGRSVAEVSLEARVKVTETIEVVPFIDGGTVYDESLPQFTDLYWGAGLGARYHTAIGPVRLDVALPLNPEPYHADFQFYISLGQAF